jgi:hypothetical protein
LKAAVSFACTSAVTRTNLLDSLLSRDGDGPLQFRADELKAVLLEQGWAEQV